MSSLIDVLAGAVPPLISALAGLGGVWPGSNATAQREIDREARTNTMERAYLSVYLSVELEKFADGCLAVASDTGVDEDGRPAGDDGAHCATASYPEFQASVVDGNWKSLSAGILDRVLSIQYRLQQHAATINAYSVHAFPPDYSEFFVARRYCFAKLGLEIVGLIDDMRKEAGLPEVVRESHEWSREKRLQATYDKFKEKME